MNSSEKMRPEEILDEIEVLFPDAHCELNHRTPFELLVAVVLSAQTTDVSVNRVTPALFARWPDAASLQNAPLAEVEDTLHTLGLYRNKSKNIIALSRELTERFDGKVPSSFEDLQSLPGVGRKTANVVRSVVFDIPSLAVDTHVERVSKRLGLAEPGDSVREVEKKLCQALPKERWNQAHHDLIFFGRYFCTARRPSCEGCPFRQFCRKEFLEAGQAAFKEKKKMSKSKSEKKTALNTAEEVRIFTQEVQDVEAGEAAARPEEAGQASLEDSFKVPSDQKELFEEAGILVQAAKAMEKGVEKAVDEQRRKREESQGSEGLQSVLDDAFRQAENSSVSNALKEEIVDGLEQE